MNGILNRMLTLFCKAISSALVRVTVVLPSFPPNDLYSTGGASVFDDVDTIPGAPLLSLLVIDE